MKLSLLLALAASVATSALALDSEVDRKVLEGLEAGYSLDFERAAAKFAQADRLDPQHPVGPFFLAALKWLEFSLNADIPESAEVLEPQFNLLIGEAFERARRMRQKDPRSAEAHFYLGAVYGMRGRWRLIRRQWIRAASDGYKGYKHLKIAVELNPELYDAYLGLGMYDYYSDKLPSVLKLASLLVARGDKARGLRYVRVAVERGRYSVMEGQLFLAGIYMAYEKEPKKALEIIADLRLKSPDNIFLLYLEVAARIHAQDWSASTALAERLAAEGRKVPFAAPHASLFDLYLADAYLGAKEYSKAKEAAERCLTQADDARRASVTYCRLRRAQAQDLLGARLAALDDYREVRARPDFWDSQEKAKLGLKTPATYERVLGELME